MNTCAPSSRLIIYFRIRGSWSGWMAEAFIGKYFMGFSSYSFDFHHLVRVVDGFSAQDERCFAKLASMKHVENNFKRC